tara:strand:+ start:996 stop:1352 length:357 start_codon:yes stop_codon:yes gene_type:complete
VKHFILLFLCVLSIEIFIRSNYIFLINSLIKVSKKAIYIVLNKKISDHWKENIITKYSLQMIKNSLQMLLIIFLIFFVFIIADNLFTGILAFTFSLNGIIESILIALSYAYIRRLILK